MFVPLLKNKSSNITFQKNASVVCPSLEVKLKGKESCLLPRPLFQYTFFQGARWLRCPFDAKDFFPFFSYNYYRTAYGSVESSLSKNDSVVVGFSCYNKTWLLYSVKAARVKFWCGNEKSIAFSDDKKTVDSWTFSQRSFRLKAEKSHVF